MQTTNRIERRRKMTPLKANIRDTVDWLIFDRHPESTVTCACGHVYRSHGKLVSVDDHFVLIARKPCGVCGGERLTAARSDPEFVSIKR